MKKYSILWAALSMMAALMMTACSNDDNANESPAQQNAAKTIPYTVTVNGGASTRATVESDNKTLYFADDDKLYVTGTNIKGVLNIQAGNGSTTGPGTASATFSGDLTYSGSGSPASDLPLTATLVSAQQNVGTSAGFEVSVDDAGAVTVNYPTTVYCADVASAVQRFSNLTGTSTYGAKSFSLTQQTAFLNFEISFADGTGITAGDNLTTAVNNNSHPICGGNVTATNDGGVIKAKFVLPVAKGTTLTNAFVKFKNDDSKVLRLRDVASLEGKVYNVKPAQSSTLASVTGSHLGWLVGSDGKAYEQTKGYLPIGVTAVAMIAYVGNDAETSPTNTAFKNGLALALEDVSEKKTWCSQKSVICLGTLGTQYTSGTKFNDLAGIDNTDALVNHTGHTHDAASAARGYNSGTHPTGTSVWFLPSAGQWDKMIGSTGLGLSNLGLLANVSYWSSTEDGASRAWGFNSYNGYWANSGSDKDVVFQVRACLAF